MNIYDIIIGLFLLLSFGLGFMKGLIHAVFNLVGFVAAFILIGRLGPLTQHSLVNKFSMNPIIATILAYILIFIAIMIIVKIIIIFATKLVKVLNLSFLNYFLGGVLGLINGIIAVIILIMIINIFPFADSVWKNTEGSYFIKTARGVAMKVKGELVAYIPEPKTISFYFKDTKK